jgi:tRNA-modifying protein YgfZ
MRLMSGFGNHASEIMAYLKLGFGRPSVAGPLAILDGMASTGQLTPEQRALREGCALLDRSERGKLALAGGGAKAFLQGQVTNDVEALEPGGGCYAAVLTPKGKMLGDLRILDAGGELLLDTERSALQAVFNVIHRSLIGYDAELHKRTVQRGLVSLIGPRARDVAGAETALLGVAEHANAAAEIDGIPVRLVATDDGGVDLLCEAERTEALIAALRARGAEPVSEAAAECLRIERGRPRYGAELDEATIPQEAGLNERAVSFTKGCYTGQETVARLYYKGKPNRHLRGVRLSEPVPAGTELTFDGRAVGTLGDVALSPVHGPIALAVVRREAAPGAIAMAGPAQAEIVELPF